MLRDLDLVSYIPILAVRPGEMRALEELPNSTKDRMLPYIPLRPWVGAHRLSSAISRIAEAYPERPIIVGVGAREPYQRRTVFDELEALRNHQDGFRNWVSFIRENDTFIPVAQLFSGDLAEERRQIERLAELGRGVAFHVPRAAFGGVAALAAQIADIFRNTSDALFILDFESVKADHLQIGMISSGLISAIRRACPLATCSVSATSFPSGFDDLPVQDIYERRLFNIIADEHDNLIYSDRGSARIDQPGGGGGQPYPRIDYPQASDWRFFRSSSQNGFEGYRAQARLLMASRYWNPQIRVWGTQMIERTEAGDRSAISDPRKATAARINLHLQIQTFFDDPRAAEETEEDWSD